jgi:beta-glucuronidase
VILWSVANETPDNPTRTQFLENLAAEAHKLDSTRLVTAAFLQPQTPGETKILTDPLAQALDVVGLNEYVGWYSYTPGQADNVKFELPQKPVIVSEFGAEAKAGNHGPKDQRWTEEFQLDFYRHNFVMLSKTPQIRGFSPWVLMDFRAPTRNIPLLQEEGSVRFHTEDIQGSHLRQGGIDEMDNAFGPPGARLSQGRLLLPG